MNIDTAKVRLLPTGNWLVQTCRATHLVSTPRELVAILSTLEAQEITTEVIEDLERRFLDGTC